MKKGSHHTSKALAKMMAAKEGEKNPFFGKTHTAQARKKFSAVHKGKKLSEETRLKISAARTVEKIKCICQQCGEEFEVHPSAIKRGEGKYCSHKCDAIHRKGIPLSEAIRTKISAANIGKPKSEEHRKKLSAARMGRFSGAENPNFGKPVSDERKAKQRAVMRGRKLNEEHKQKIRAHTPRGKNSPHWQNGKSFEPYCPFFNSFLKERVRSFFERHCVLCGKNEVEYGKKLDVHHVTIEKMACCESKIEEMNEVRNRLPSNVARFGENDFSDLEITYIRMMVPLCKSCHGKSHGKSNEAQYRKLFSDIIIDNYGGKCYYEKEKFEKLNQK